MTMFDKHDTSFNVVQMDTGSRFRPKTPTGFEVNGQLFRNEHEAVTKALQNISDDIKKKYPNNPIDGILEHEDDLIYLLERRREITPKPSATYVDDGVQSI